MKNESKNSMLELTSYTNLPIERSSAVCLYFVQREFSILQLMTRENYNAMLWLVSS